MYCWFVNAWLLSCNKNNVFAWTLIVFALCGWGEKKMKINLPKNCVDEWYEPDYREPTSGATGPTRNRRVRKAHLFIVRHFGTSSILDLRSWACSQERSCAATMTDVANWQASPCKRQLNRDLLLRVTSTQKYLLYCKWNKRKEKKI